eukprot:jgi/Mesvir1/16720/Mv15111-RA.3
MLIQEGYDVCVLTRDVRNAQNTFPESKYPSDRLTSVAVPGWSKAICGCKAVVNLAGAPISARWTPEVKASIMTSRVNATERVARAISECPAESRPSVLVSASAVGYYGCSDTATFEEASKPGSDYLAQVCQAWEQQARSVPEGVSVLIVRSGIALDTNGGVLGKLLPVFLAFAGGPLGTGKQWMSWIHREDLCQLYLLGVTSPEKFNGVVNGTAPYPATMNDFCRALGRALGRPSWAPVPDIVVKTLLGEGAVVVLDGQKVVPKRTQDLGFTFKYPTLDAALKEIVPRV